MSTQSQYGHTLFLDGFQSGSSAKKLERVHFSKKVSESALFDEAWLQNLIMSHPSLLPVDQIEAAFADLVPMHRVTDEVGISRQPPCDTDW